MGVRLKRLKMVSTYIWVDTIASSDGVRKVCCPDGYCRSAFFCGVLVVFAMVAIVMLGLAAEQPVHQKAIAEGWTPLIMLMAAICGICHFFHGLVKNKIKRLNQ
ncbi:hypothetical protein [Pseudomonas syringae]|uniref:hypothetical protein n=1 Tax=Pseudomonas syringae TaxID=317 RepID=UPI00070C15D9|nr:hypothetical protein [Pseudomonas syringae]